jgi:myotubularin-related protein 5/13
MSNMEVWSFYLGEELCHGPSYDLEVVQQDAAAAEEETAASGTAGGQGALNSIKAARKLVTTG